MNDDKFVKRIPQFLPNTDSHEPFLKERAILQRYDYLVNDVNNRFIFVYIGLQRIP